MAFDQHKNLAVATVATAPSPATSGTSLTVAAGEAARFPAVPFSATIWPPAALPNPVTAEVVRVTGRSGDTLTIVRGQEGTAPRAVVSGDLIAATITVKAFTDIESGTNFPLITTPGGVTLGGDLVLVTGGFVRTATADGADTAALHITGGGYPAPDRGAFVSLYGNDHAAAGILELYAGTAATGRIQFLTGPSALRGVIHPSGGFTWGSGGDPGTNNFAVGTPGATMFLGTTVQFGYPSRFAAKINAADSLGINIGTTTNSPTGSFIGFYNAANALQGTIGSPNANTTAYNTTSDERLKNDQGAHTRDAAGGVLRDTVIHDFTWKADGSPGRGVFAQEAMTVAPFAVSPGTDETLPDGQLRRPWAVDYAKYVPDLIVGWQAHEATIAALVATVAALEARLAALEAAP